MIARILQRLEMLQAMRPIREWHTTGTLTGSGNVNDLPVTHYTSSGGGGASVASVWKAGIIGRLIFMFSGRVTFYIYGKTHAPINMVVGSGFRKE